MPGGVGCTTRHSLFNRKMARFAKSKKSYKIRSEPELHVHKKLTKISANTVALNDDLDNLGVDVVVLDSPYLEVGCDSPVVIDEEAALVKFERLQLNQNALKALMVGFGVKPHTRKTIRQICETFGTSDFDVLELQEVIPGNVLAFVGLLVFQQYDFETSVGLNMDKFRAFLIKSQCEYKHKNPFHHSAHAADVLHSAHLLLHSTGLKNILEPHLQCMLLISAIVHDLGHIGLTNKHLKERHHEIAIKYPVNSPLEAMHISLAIQILSSEKFDVFPTMEHQLKRECFQLIHKMIDATDLARRNETLDAVLKHTNGNNVFKMSTIEDKYAVMGVVLHAADIGGSTKPFAIHEKWCLSLSEEMYQQGDVENSLGMPLSFGCDRSKHGSDFAKEQVFFMNYFVKGVYETLNVVEGVDVSAILNQLNSNVDIWRKRVTGN